jgi:hypothetical protein
MLESGNSLLYRDPTEDASGARRGPSPLLAAGPSDSRRTPAALPSAATYAGRRSSSARRSVARPHRRRLVSPST